jgi:serine protease inhibitor
MKKSIILLITLSISYVINAQTIVEGNNQFAFDLLKQLGTQNQNTFFSPYSISTALFMTAGGARGNTEKQMLKVLHQAQNSLAYHKKFGEIITKATNKQNVELSIANSIWPQKGFKFKPDYLNLLKSAYKTKVTESDFAKNPNAEAQKINKWVEEKTKSKITNIIKPDVLDANTKLVLANAIYFYGYWKTTFDTAKNQIAPFYKNGGTQVNTTFMNASYSMDYASDEMFKVVSIPYKNNEVSLLLILPNNPDSFKLAMNSLDIRRYFDLSKSLKPEKVNLSLPKFKMESEFYLEEKLPAMGMSDAFTKEADFSGMTGNKSLSISKVIHKAFIDVSEKGTEAAAATVVIMSRNGGSHKPIEFKADHPFIFMIKDNSTGQILFMGILNDPKG